MENSFIDNLEPVEHLLRLHAGLTTGLKRWPVNTSNVRCSPVVFIPPSLPSFLPFFLSFFIPAPVEDFPRSLLEWTLPSAQASHLKDLLLVGKKP